MPKRTSSAARASSRSTSKANTKQVNNTKAVAKTKKVTKAQNTKVAKSAKSGKTNTTKVSAKGKTSGAKQTSKPAQRSSIKVKTSSRSKTPAKAPSKQKSVDPKPKTEKKVKAAPTVPLGYTAAEFQKYKEEKIRLSKLNNAEMKAILKKNLQSMSGNKDELIEKIADGIVLGRIPRCPSCYGGRPKFDKKTGKYTCPGYRDDVEYQNCHKIFEKSDLKRDPWEA